LKILNELLSHLSDKQLSFFDLLLFLFRPEQHSKTTNVRREIFWSYKEKVCQLLRYWTDSRQTQAGKDLVIDWMVNFVGQKLQDEAKAITSRGTFRTAGHQIGPEYLQNVFKVSEIIRALKTHCPLAFRVFTEFATSTHQQGRSSEVASRSGEIVSNGLMRPYQS
jgi:hypothetical protein